MTMPIPLELPATREQLRNLRAGDAVMLYGTIYTMRDAGHQRACAYLDEYGELPFNLEGQALFYAGPTPSPTPGSTFEPTSGFTPSPTPGSTTETFLEFASQPALSLAVRLPERPFGAIGPTTASRMDFFTPQLLRAGITVMLGKGRRSPVVVEACAQTESVYLAATGGAAALLAGFVTSAKTVAWEDLGTEALRKLTLNGMPAFVAINSRGDDLYARL